MIKRFSQINQIFDDYEDVISCDYYSIDEINKLNTDKHELYKLHLYIYSLSLHTGDLKSILSLLTAKVGILCISVSRISQNNLAITNLHISGYNLEKTLTESSTEGTLMYISKDISYIL